jgi:hypothetical protein
MLSTDIHRLVDNVENYKTRMYSGFYSDIFDIYTTSEHFLWIVSGFVHKSSLQPNFLSIINIFKMNFASLIVQFIQIYYIKFVISREYLSKYLFS